MPNLSDNLRGALLMTLSMTAFTVNDAFLKAMTDELPLFQLLFFRGMGVVAILTVLTYWRGQLQFKQSKQDWTFIILRTLSEIGAAFFFLSALRQMPIANVSAILQALPLTVSLAGAAFLGEALGWRRFAAIIIGFCGVLLIIKPGGADFNSYSLYALTAVACVTFRDIIVRRMSKDVPSMFVGWFTALGVMTFAGFASLTEDWQTLSPTGQLQMLGTTVFIVAGYILSVSVMRVGEIAFVAPFRYTSLLVAIILGIVFFGEIPDRLTILGATIVVATGLFTLYREAKVKARAQ